MMTATQPNETEDYMPEYISIYDRPKRSVGRQKNLTQLTDEEKKIRMRKIASKHYYENRELRQLQQAQVHLRRKREKEQSL